MGTPSVPGPPPPPAPEMPETSGMSRFLARRITIVVVAAAALLGLGLYAAAYAAYPVWQGACLIVGVAVPARDDEARARDVRDRFVKEVLPKVEVVATEEPTERY